MRFYRVATGAFVIGATLTEARSLGANPSGDHEFKHPKEPLHLATSTSLHKRSELAGDDWNATSSSVPSSQDSIDPSSYQASNKTATSDADNLGYPGSGDHEPMEAESRKKYRSRQRLSPQSSSDSVTQKNQRESSEISVGVGKKPADVTEMSRAPAYKNTRVNPSEANGNESKSKKSEQDREARELMSKQAMIGRKIATPEVALLSAIEKYRDAISQPAKDEPHNVSEQTAIKSFSQDSKQPAQYLTQDVQRNVHPLSLTHKPQTDSNLANEREFITEFPNSPPSGPDFEAAQQPRNLGMLPISRDRSSATTINPPHKLGNVVTSGPSRVLSNGNLLPNKMQPNPASPPTPVNSIHPPMPPQGPEAASAPPAPSLPAPIDPSSNTHLFDNISSLSNNIPMRNANSNTGAPIENLPKPPTGAPSPVKDTNSPVAIGSFPQNFKIVPSPSKLTAPKP